jgi:toxin ParE1/3/4
MRRVFFLRAAGAELASAVRYYEQQRQELGLEFSAAVDEAIERIQSHPNAGTLVKPRTRQRRVQGFPYTIIYALPPGRIRVIAVMHLRRRPDYWAHRR